MAAKVQIIIQALDKASGTLSKVNQSLGKTGTAAKGTAGQFANLAAGWAKTVFSAAALGGAALALANYLNEAGKTAGRFAEINAKQNAILEATGHAAGFTSEQLDKMARELTKLTEIELSTIKETQSLMLTFRNISGETFPRAMKAAADLATTFGGINSAAMQLGKALNDPIQGITALNRAGVTFSDEQKETIRTMVEMGDVAGAQAIILAEVEAQVGGTAAAIAEAGDGSGRLKASLEILSAEMGRGVLPAQQTWNNLLADTIDYLAELAANSADSNEETDKLGRNLLYYSGRYSQALVDLERGAGMTARAMQVLDEANEEVTKSTNEAAQAADEAMRVNKEVAQQLDELTKLTDEYGKLQGKNAGEFEDASRRRRFALLTEKLEAAGLMGEMEGFLTELGLSWGIYSQEAIDAQEKITRQSELITAAIDAIPDRKTLEFILEAIMSIPFGADFTGGGGGGTIGGGVGADGPTPMARGGPVNAGQLYMVGEVGPELFVPQTSGQIVPNHALGGGSTTVTIVYSPTYSTASPQEMQAFVPVVESALRKIKGFA